MRITAVTDRDKALKLISKPSYKRSVRIRDDMVLFQNHISCVTLNRPIYVGFSVLELSKLHMAQFHYDKMTSWFDDIQLCFTDTGKHLCMCVCVWVCVCALTCGGVHVRACAWV